jgi:predicted chitinase
MITREQMEVAYQPIRQVPGPRVNKIIAALDKAMSSWGIETVKQQCAFIATLLLETGGFRWLEELADGSAYEGRRDLGNTQPGDGPRFKGRGFIQLTGRSNYARAGKELGLDLLQHPELAEEIEHAAQIACWFWVTRGCNKFAEDGNFKRTQIIVNGRNRKTGLPNHWEQRLDIYQKLIAQIQLIKDRATES